MAFIKVTGAMREERLRNPLGRGSHFTESLAAYVVCVCTYYNIPSVYWYHHDLTAFAPERRLNEVFSLGIPNQALFGTCPVLFRDP